MSRVIDNLLAVKREIAEACAAAGRDAGNVGLLVVSKTIPIPVLMELYDFGIREFGENREPELAMKAAAMPRDIVWHFIGPVQSNKIRKVVRAAKVIHSVESAAQLAKFDRVAGEEAVTPDILLEVNVSGEVSKGGMTPAALPEIAAAAARCSHLRFRGLMTMAPLDAAPGTLTEVFSTLHSLRDELEKTLHLSLPLLSMGMSGDFPAAIACGSTLVRVGSRIFDGVKRLGA